MCLYFWHITSDLVVDLSCWHLVVSIAVVIVPVAQSDEKKLIINPPVATSESLLLFLVWQSWCGRDAKYGQQVSRWTRRHNSIGVISVSMINLIYHWKRSMDLIRQYRRYRICITRWREMISIITLIFFLLTMCVLFLGACAGSNKKGKNLRYLWVTWGILTRRGRQTSWNF